MARARNIKPGFFKNEILAEIEPMGRLLFIGLWTLADREGRLEYRPKRIKAELFPYEDCDVEGCCRELESRNFLTIYEVGKALYLQILTFGKHQHPHPNERASALPDPEKDESAYVKDESARENGLSTQADIPTTLPPDSLPPEFANPNGLEADSKPSPPCPHQEIIAAYHEILPECRQVRVWNKQREGYLRARWKEDPQRQSLDWWRKWFSYVHESPFLIGKTNGSGDRPSFVADLEWLVRPQNFAKIIEGKYHD